MDKAHAKVIGISVDDLATQKRFKAEVAPNITFIADADSKLVGLYDVKMAVVSYAKRTTFVVGKDRKILHIDTDADAIDPSAAITSCPIQ